MTKLLAALLLTIGVSVPAHATDPWTAGVIGGMLGYTLGRSTSPDVVVVQPG